MRREGRRRAANSLRPRWTDRRACVVLAVACAARSTSAAVPLQRPAFAGQLTRTRATPFLDTLGACGGRTGAARFTGVRLGGGVLEPAGFVGSEPSGGVVGSEPPAGSVGPGGGSLVSTDSQSALVVSVGSALPLSTSVPQLTLSTLASRALITSAPAPPLSVSAPAPPSSVSAPPPPFR